MGPDPICPAFQAIAGDLDYPMTIVTTAHAGERAGCLVGFMAQCSINPPLLMVWLSKQNRTTRLAMEAHGLVVHFPSEDDLELAQLFGATTGDTVDKFSLCHWEDGPDGLPLLTDCTRWVVGRILQRVDTGDHVGHLVELVDGACGEWSGQLRYQAVKGMEPGHSA